jgi:hypothetical protein
MLERVPFGHNSQLPRVTVPIIETPFKKGLSSLLDVAVYILEGLCSCEVSESKSVGRRATQAGSYSHIIGCVSDNITIFLVKFFQLKRPSASRPVYRIIEIRYRS